MGPNMVIRPLGVTRCARNCGSSF